jgi:hypothetical protein
MRTEVAEGVRWLWNHPLIRYMAFLTGMLNFAGQGVTLIAVVLARGQGASPAEVGAIFAAGGVGGVLGALAGLAGVAVASGDYRQAAHLLGAAAALREAVDAARLVHHERYERALAATRAGLEAAVFAQAWAAGRALTPAEIALLAAEIVPARD